MRGVIAIGLMFWANTAAALPDSGCYTRVYGEVHLENNPDQVVAAIRLRFTDFDDTSDTVGADIEAVFADQGHAAADGFGGKVLAQSLFCQEIEGTTKCMVDCDAGSFDVVRQDGGVLEIRTYGVEMGEWEGCSGYSNLSEGTGEAVTYRLFRTDDAACMGFKYDQ